jgi:hypothetical protein
MANGDKDNTTAASKVTEMGLTGDTGVTSTGLAPDPNAVVLPERVLDLTNTKNLDALKVEAGYSPRATSVGKEGQKNYQPLFQPAVGLAATLPSTLKAQRGPGGTRWVYVGENLVDENNVLQPKYTGSSEDIYKEFFRLKNDADRSQLFQTMERLGYYQNTAQGKPSPMALQGDGLTNTDEAAMRDFMLQLANNKGRTMKALVNLYATGAMKFPTGLAGGGRTVSVVSREDAAKQTGNAFFELLGRAATPAEVKIAVQAIQDMDRKRQLSNVENPTTLGVAAEQQAMQASPGEFGAYSAGKAINQIFSLLGGA